MAQRIVDTEAARPVLPRRAAGGTSGAAAGLPAPLRGEEAAGRGRVRAARGAEPRIRVAGAGRPSEASPAVAPTPTPDITPETFSRVLRSTRPDPPDPAAPALAVTRLPEVVPASAVGAAVGAESAVETTPRPEPTAMRRAAAAPARTANPVSATDPRVASVRAGTVSTFPRGASAGELQAARAGSRVAVPAPVLTLWKSPHATPAAPVSAAPTVALRATGAGEAAQTPSARARASDPRALSAAPAPPVKGDADTRAPRLVSARPAATPSAADVASRRAATLPMVSAPPTAPARIGLRPPLEPTPPRAPNRTDVAAVRPARGGEARPSPGPAPAVAPTVEAPLAATPRSTRDVWRQSTTPARGATPRPVAESAPPSAERVSGIRVAPRQAGPARGAETTDGASPLRRPIDSTRPTPGPAARVATPGAVAPAAPAPAAIRPAFVIRPAGGSAAAAGEVRAVRPERLARAADADPSPALPAPTPVAALGPSGSDAPAGPAATAAPNARNAGAAGAPHRVPQPIKNMDTPHSAPAKARAGEGEPRLEPGPGAERPRAGTGVAPLPEPGRLVPADPEPARLSPALAAFAAAPLLVDPRTGRSILPVEPEIPRGRGMTSDAGTFAPHALNGGLRPRDGAATSSRREGHEQAGAGRTPGRRVPADDEAPLVGGRPVAFGPVPTPEPTEPLGPPPTFGTAMDDALGPPPSAEAPAGDVNAPHLALPSIVPLETARRVSERLLAAVKAGDRQVELQLDPPHLGRLRVRLEMEGQHVSATLVTQTEAARELLMNQSADLQKSLAAQGLTLTAFDITLEGRQARPDHEGTSEGGRAGAEARGSATAGPAASRPEESPDRVRLGINRVDLVA